MVSLAVCFLNAIARLIPKSSSRYFASFYGVPFPSVQHKYLDSKTIEQFEEVLIIGDVHGCLDELLTLLEKANAFDNKILKIFVGDLVNKGPKNLEVLNFVSESSSMLSVRGNHDELIIKEYMSFINQKAFKEKYTWVKDITVENIDFLSSLPYTISIPSLNCTVVHAGLLPGIPLESNAPMDMIHMRNIIMTDYFWESGLIATNDPTEGEPWAKMWGGPQHVYFGHDAKRMFQSYPYATGLDTGCVYGKCLSGMFIHGPRKGELIQVNALKMYSEPKTKNNSEL